MAQLDKTIIDLTKEPEFETQKFPSFQEISNPFLNEDSPVLERDVIDLGHDYLLRPRISYKLNRIKMLINEIEHDLAIGYQARK